MKNQIILNLQLVCQNLYGLPTIKIFKLWMYHVFLIHKKKIELTIRIVDTQEMHYLNWYYLGKNFPTNVLSFPVSHPLGMQASLLGDIVICRQIIEHEAKKYNISTYAHWAHIVIHGSLHLLGYDHILKEDAQVMEQLEINIMRKIGYTTCYYLINN